MQTDFLRYPGKIAQPELAELLWLIKLRWMAIAVLVLVIWPAFHFGYLEFGSALIYGGMISLLILFNLKTASIYSRGGGTVSPIVMCYQLGIDLVVLTVLLFLTDGAATPFVALFFLNASLGGLLIPGRLSWPFLVLMHSLLGFLQFQLRSGGRIPSGADLTAMMVGTHFLLFGFWLVMRSLGGYLEEQRNAQVNARVLLEKRDRLRAIGALAAGFSHEFASPLNAAKLRLERLQRNASNEDVEAALSAVQACEDVVHQMNSSQMDAREFRHKKVRVSDLLGDVIDSWQEDRPNIQVERSIVDVGQWSLPPLNFAQVILNLLDNAAEAMAGHPAPKIQIRLHRANGRIEFVVEDEGPGFLKDVLDKIGEPFNTGRSEGTGLGLYVSQLFAASLGGDLSIRMRPSILGKETKGAQVTVHWPANNPEE